jgi:hypothetical protein
MTMDQSVVRGVRITRFVWLRSSHSAVIFVLICNTFAFRCSTSDQVEREREGLTVLVGAI